MAFTTINDPSEYFHTQLYSGDGGGSNAITNDANAGDFKPDWLWIKERTATSSNTLVDSNRGAGKILLSDNTNAEASAPAVSSFNTDGFTLGSDGKTNEVSQNYVAWQWKAGGTTPTKTYKVVVVSDGGNKYRFRNSGDTATFAQSAVTLDLQEGGTYIFDQSDSSNSGHPLRFSETSNGSHGGGSEFTTGVTTSGTPGNSGAFTQITVSASAPTLYYYCTQHSGMGGQVNTNTTHGQTNFDGSTLSVSQTNTTAGFSIVTYTGTGSNATVGHGLGATSKAYIVKNRTDAADWFVYHSSLGTPLNEYLQLNSANAVGSNSGTWNSNPTSSVFGLGSTFGALNGSSKNYVAYVFAEKQGYSKFGSYTGNGNNDGAFVYTGFKPAWVMIKCTSEGSRNWVIYDNKRETFNEQEYFIRANNSGAEQRDDGYSEIDLLSNGFKLRGASGDTNKSSATYIYMAFAEHPFVSSEGVPTTAR